MDLRDKIWYNVIMETAMLEKKDKKKLERIFGIKSYDEILNDLSISRAQAKSGKLIPADKALKELRTKYAV